MKHAVNAVLDGHFLVASLDVNIAGAPLQGIKDGGVHQLDDRRDIRIGRGEPVDGQRLIRVFFVAHDVQREAFGDFVEHALGLLGFLEQVGNLREGRHLDPQLLVQEHAELVNHTGVARVGHGDFEGPVLALNRHEIVTEHQVDGDGMEQVVVDANFAEVDELVVIALGEGAGPRRLLHRIYR